MDERRQLEPRVLAEHARHRRLARPGDAEDLDLSIRLTGRRTPADRCWDDPRQGPSDPD
jgi:hypothetical protein